MSIKKRLIVGLVVLVCGFLLGGCQTLEQKELSRLEGGWLCEQCGIQAVLNFSGNNFEFKKLKSSKKILGTFNINPEMNPKRIKFIVEETNVKFIGMTSLGIYKIEGKKLLLVGNRPGSVVSAEKFETDKGTNLLVFTKQ